MADPTETTVEISEETRVTLHRYREARQYGFTKLDSRLFAESAVDVGELRRLKRDGCPARTAAKILL